MPSGLLEVRGTISFKQFWPSGTSDADTTKLIVRVERDGFRYRTPGAERFRTTRAFDGAVVIGRAGRREAARNGQVTVRLQGIDAPELHYRPPSALSREARSAKQHAAYLLWNHEYRQPLAETATVALRAFLADTGRSPVPCAVRTQVDEPGEVFDTYGRLVGDVYVTIGGIEQDLNHWLVEMGWALPAFYSSMTWTRSSRCARSPPAPHAGGVASGECWATRVPTSTGVASTAARVQSSFPPRTAGQYSCRSSFVARAHGP